MISITVQYFYDHNREDLNLEFLAGREGLDRHIRIARIQKPGLALAGYFDQLHPERVQILGETEISYLSTLEKKLARKRLAELCSTGIACLIVAKGLDIPEDLIDMANSCKVPLFRTTEISSTLIRTVTTYLEDVLAPETSIHGCMVDVHGVGILFMGKSGIGKSECALGLVERGHRLVADDVVIIKRKVPGVLFASGADLIRNHMEIRGLGIINIKDLYGVSSIRTVKKVEHVVELIEWEEGLDVERVGLTEYTYSILGVEVPFLQIPVRPGRDLTLIVEVAARNHLLKTMGYHAAQEFDAEFFRRTERVNMKKKKPDLESVE